MDWQPNVMSSNFVSGLSAQSVSAIGRRRRFTPDAERIGSEFIAQQARKRTNSFSVAVHAQEGSQS